MRVSVGALIKEKQEEKQIKIDSKNLSIVKTKKAFDKKRLNNNLEQAYLIKCLTSKLIQLKL